MLLCANLVVYRRYAAVLAVHRFCQTRGIGLRTPLQRIDQRHGFRAKIKRRYRRSISASTTLRTSAPSNKFRPRHPRQNRSARCARYSSARILAIPPEIPRESIHATVLCANAARKLRRIRCASTHHCIARATDVSSRAPDFVPSCAPASPLSRRRSFAIRAAFSCEEDSLPDTCPKISDRFLYTKIAGPLDARQIQSPPSQADPAPASAAPTPSVRCKTQRAERHSPTQGASRDTRPAAW